MNSRLRTLAFMIYCLALGSAVFAANTATTGTPLDGKGSRSAETTLGDFVADAVRATAKADIAFISSSMINEVTIPAGPVSNATLASALAFPDDTIAVLSLSGKQIRKALERSLELYPKNNSAFLQVSGLSVIFDPSASPGTRLISVDSGGISIQPGRTYEVAMPISLGRGSLGYFRIWSKEDMTRSIDNTLSTAVVNYAQSRGAFAYHSGDRIMARAGQK